MKKSINLVILGLGLSGGTPCTALQTYPLVDHQKTEIQISKTEFNRIAVIGDRIGQVFGADGIFDVGTDDEGGQIFLKLNMSPWSLHPPDAKSVTVTIITEEGLTQDLKLIPKAIESQSILLRPSHASQQGEVHKDESQLHQILILMKAMVRNEDVQGFKKKETEPLTSSSLMYPALEMVELALYSNEHFEGRRYSITNNGDKPFHLKKEDFKGKSDLALTFSKSLIHPKETITFYRISRRAE